MRRREPNLNSIFFLFILCLPRYPVHMASERDQIFKFKFLVLRIDLKVCLCANSGDNKRNLFMKLHFHFDRIQLHRAYIINTHSTSLISISIITVRPCGSAATNGMARVQIVEPCPSIWRHLIYSFNFCLCSGVIACALVCFTAHENQTIEEFIQTICP